MEFGLYWGRGMGKLLRVQLREALGGPTSPGLALDTCLVLCVPCSIVVLMWLALSLLLLCSGLPSYSPLARISCTTSLVTLGSAWPWAAGREWDRCFGNFILSSGGFTDPRIPQCPKPSPCQGPFSSAMHLHE